MKKILLFFTLVFIWHNLPAQTIKEINDFDSLTLISSYKGSLENIPMVIYEYRYASVDMNTSQSTRKVKRYIGFEGNNDIYWYKNSALGQYFKLIPESETKYKKFKKLKILVPLIAISGGVIFVGALPFFVIGIPAAGATMMGMGAAGMITAGYCKFFSLRNFYSAVDEYNKHIKPSDEKKSKKKNKTKSN